jgi:16S rRNA G527 N7-methylase RsmG
MSAALENTLQHYQQQVLRWNSHINLVSRQDSAETLADLVDQCRDAWDGLMEARCLGTADPLWYFDLGSGGGLPGFVWHAQAEAANLPIRTWLVEPREKRAWFLKRLNNLLGENPVTVLAGRWGEIDDFELQSSEITPSVALISLKALHLTDSEVLAGLAPVLTNSVLQGQVTVLIARFYPPEQAWTAVLAEDLDIPSAGDTPVFAHLNFEGRGGTILPPESPEGASLVLSEYLTRTNS